MLSHHICAHFLLKQRISYLKKSKRLLPKCHAGFMSVSFLISWLQEAPVLMPRCGGGPAGAGTPGRVLHREKGVFLRVRRQSQAGPRLSGPPNRMWGRRRQSSHQEEGRYTSARWKCRERHSRQTEQNTRRHDTASLSGELQVLYQSQTLECWGSAGERDGGSLPGG